MKLHELDVDEAIGHVGEVLSRDQKSKGLLIHAFQQIQKEHNYLPEEELKRQHDREQGEEGEAREGHRP